MQTLPCCLLVALARAVTEWTVALLRRQLSQVESKRPAAAAPTRHALENHFVQCRLLVTGPRHDVLIVGGNVTTQY